MVIVARDFKTSSWIEIEIRNGIIAAVRPLDGPAERSPNDDWVGPAFWDIQLNGRWGHSFSSPELTVEHVVAIVRTQGSLGTARLCPTLITAPPGQMLHGVRTIAAACEADPETARVRYWASTWRGRSCRTARASGGLIGPMPFAIPTLTFSTRSRTHRGGESSS